MCSHNVAKISAAQSASASRKSVMENSQQLPALQASAQLCSVAEVATTQCYLTAQGCATTLRASRCSSFHYIDSRRAVPGTSKAPSQEEVEFVVPISAKARHLTAGQLLNILDGLPAGPTWDCQGTTSINLLPQQINLPATACSRDTPAPATAASGSSNSLGHPGLAVFKGANVAVVDGSVVSLVSLMPGLQPPAADD